MTLDFAQRCASRLLERLSLVCQRVEIAGSIRRGRAEVGDIDLVVIPQIEQVTDLLGTPIEERNRTAIEIRTWAEAGGWSILRDGPDFLEWTTGKVQVDLWWATPDRWGTLLMCRTGSKEHNIWLCTLAQDRGGKWNPHWGLYLPGFPRVSQTEEEIYEALRLPFIAPSDREPHRFRNLRPAAA